MYGAAFGAAGTSAGLTLAQTCVLSLVMFTGASQFALVGVLGAGGGPVTAVSAALLLGVRNSIYGLRLAPELALRGWRRAAAAHLVIDETTAMATAQPTTRQLRLAFVVTGASLFLGWNVTTALGALGAQGLTGTGRAALDAIVPAAFLALLWPRLRAGADQRRVALGGAVLALGLTPVLPPGVQVLAAASAVVLGLRRS